MYAIIYIMEKIDISILLTFHNEGIAAHKTFLALKRMLHRLDDNGISHEIIAHIDNGDDETIRYINSIKKDLKLRIFENSFGNPSASRNFIINEARGKYVCLMDGDDLFSEDWLLDSFNIQEEAIEEIILHPEFNITFGLNEQSRLWRMKDSFDEVEDTLILLGRNRWCSGTFLPLKVAKKVLYKEAVGCYGYEDWWYNCETRAKGIKHNITPNSIEFYRVREESIYHQHVNANTTVAYSEAFSFENMEKCYTSNPIENVTLNLPTDNNRALHILRIGHKVLRHTPIIKKADKKIMHEIEQCRAKKVYDSLPEVVINEWKNINRIDGTTYPDPEIISRMPFYDSEVDGYGRIFCKIMHEVKQSPDYVFMMPRMGIGGTEKVLENYLCAIKEKHPDWHVLVLGKLPDNHPYKIPNNVTFVDFSCEAFSCNDWDLAFILTRLLVQAKFKRIHIVNNEFYYRWAISNKELLRENNIILNISFFMHEYTKDEGRIQSFADPFLTELAPCINKIFTDNATIVDDLKWRLGFDADKFSVHYQPVSLRMRKPKKDNASSHKILWASRVAPQKRPDILKAISKKLPDGYSIDVYGRIERSLYKEKYFNDCKNIKYKGAFSDISKLPIDKYDAYLYTSQTDGIPNILLEISSLGLPIIATKEGGVPDFIEDGISGRLVDIDDIDGYVDALVDTINSKKSASFVKHAQEKIQDRHTWELFVQEVEKDI